MASKILLVFSIIIFFLGVLSVAAQPVPPVPPPPNPVPISGIEILLGAGALFGVKRLLDKRKGDTST